MNEDRWRAFTWREKMGHIASEMSRAKHWEERGDAESRARALERALGMIDVTLQCYRDARRREISRLRELTAHCLTNSKAYDVSLDDLEHYALSHIGMA